MTSPGQPHLKTPLSYLFRALDKGTIKESEFPLVFAMKAVAVFFKTNNANGELFFGGKFLIDPKYRNDFSVLYCPNHSNEEALELFNFFKPRESEFLATAFFLPGGSESIIQEYKKEYFEILNLSNPATRKAMTVRIEQTRTSSTEIYDRISDRT